MLTRGGINCDWIETYLHVPEGAHVGQWLVLMEWQREFIYQIYNNQGDGTFIMPADELMVLERLLTASDRAALELAMTDCRALEGRPRQLDQLLEQRPRVRVQMLCSYVCQSQNMELGPHEAAPGLPRTAGSRTPRPPGARGWPGAPDRLRRRP